MQSSNNSGREEARKEIIFHLNGFSVETNAIKITLNGVLEGMPFDFSEKYRLFQREKKNKKDIWK